MQRVWRGMISSELLICGGGVCSILLLPLVARCIETMYVYGACLFYVCCSDCVRVCGNVCCVVGIVEDSVLVLEYVVGLCMGCDGYGVLCLNCEAWSCRCSCMGSVSVSSCNPVVVLNVSSA